MPVITFFSPKGGAGKSTAATIIGNELAERGASVEIVDADANTAVSDWAKLPGAPPNLRVTGHINEDNIVDRIEQAAVRSPFVLVDLEGTASLMASLATALSDFVVIPLQGSHLDAKQAARAVKLVKNQERVNRRSILYAALFTRTHPAVVPPTQRHIEASLKENAVPVFATRLSDREAYRAIFSFGGTLSSLPAKSVPNLAAARANARSLTAELIERLRAERPKHIDQKKTDAPTRAFEEMSV
jgi:chromosome partitioning protein